MKNMNKFCPIVKVEENPDGTMKVYGLVTAELPDRDNEICHYASTAPYYRAMAAEFEKATSIPGVDPSIAPLREMHCLSAVGKGTQMDFHDTEKAILMGFEVVDPSAVTKVKKGVYTGFSQGGQYVKTWTKEWKDPKDPNAVGKSYVWYTAKVGEISLVDSPCLEEARFEYVKADGSKEMRKFSKADAMEVTGTGQLDLKLTTADVLRIAEATAELVKGQADEDDDEDGKEKKDKAIVPAEESPEGKPAPVNANPAMGVADKEPPQGKADLPGAIKIKAALDRIITKSGLKPLATIGEQAEAIKSVYYFLTDRALPEQIGAAMFTATKASRTGDGPVLIPEKYAVDVVRALKSSVSPDVMVLNKSMWDIHSVTEALTTLFYTQRCLAEEAIFEGDESRVPEDLADLLETLVEIFIALVGEETSELLAAISGQKGATKAMSTELEKARKSVAEHLKAAHGMIGDHCDKAVGMCKSHHDVMKGHMDSLKAALGTEKAAGVKDIIDKAMGSLEAHTDKAYKAAGSHNVTMKTHMNKIAKAIGSEELEVEGIGPNSIDVEGPGGGAHPHKASGGGEVTMEGIAALFTKMLDDRDEKNATEDAAEMAEAFKAAGYVVAPDAKPAPAPGIGNRAAVVKYADAPLQTQIHPVGKDGDVANAAEVTKTDVSAEIGKIDVAKAVIQKDPAELLKFARTITPSAGGIPSHLSGIVSKLGQ